LSIDCVLTEVGRFSVFNPSCALAIWVLNIDFVSVKGLLWKGRTPAKRCSDAKVSTRTSEQLVKGSNRTCMALDLGIYRGQNLYGRTVIGRGL